MSGITPLKKQAVIVGGGSPRLVPFSEAKELEKNLSAARWLNKKFPVHRHDGEHSLIDRDDGTCPHCRPSIDPKYSIPKPKAKGGYPPDEVEKIYLKPAGSCELVKISALEITPAESSKPLARGTYKRPEALTLSGDSKRFISHLPEGLKDEFKKPLPSFDEASSLLASGPEDSESESEASETSETFQNFESSWEDDKLFPLFASKKWKLLVEEIKRYREARRGTLSPRQIARLLLAQRKLDEQQDKQQFHIEVQQEIARLLRELKISE